MSFKNAKRTIESLLPLVVIPFGYHFKIIILHFALISFLSAGPPDTLWTRTYGGDSGDVGCSVLQTGDGGFVIAGTTSSFGAGMEDIYLIRTDPGGDTLWTKTYGGASSDAASSAQVTGDGGFAISGTTYRNGNGDFFLVRTGPDGDTLWTKAYGCTTEERGYSLCQTLDGGFVIAGFSIQAGTKVCLLRTDSDGDSVWMKIYARSTISDNEGHYVQQTLDGGFIVVGRTVSPLKSEDSDVYFIRANPDGDTLWTRAYGGSIKDWGVSAQRADDGGFVVSGTTESYGSWWWNVYMVRIDPYGNELSSMAFGGKDLDYCMSMQKTVDGGFIVCGYTTNPDSGSRDIYLVRTDSYCDSLWTKTFGDAFTDEVGKSVRQTSDSGFIICGSARPVGEDNLDVYLMRLGKETTVIQDENHSIFLKPNDLFATYNSGNITIRYTITRSTYVKLEAFDVQGRLVGVIADKFVQKGSCSIKWDAERFGAGVYYIKLATEHNIFVQEIVIIK